MKNYYSKEKGYESIKNAILLYPNSKKAEIARKMGMSRQGFCDFIKRHSELNELYAKQKQQREYNECYIKDGVCPRCHKQLEHHISLDILEKHINNGKIKDIIERLGDKDLDYITRKIYHCYISEVLNSKQLKNKSQ